MAQQLWQKPSVLILRSLINDLDCPQKYTDNRLSQVLSVAGYQLLRETEFGQPFAVDVVAQSITPDPMDVTNQTSDDNFINLMTMKAACIIDTGSAMLAAQAATAGKDMNTAWDLRGVAENLMTLLDKGWCATFEETFDKYLSGEGTISAAIMSPFRLRARQYSTPFLYGYLRGY